jgi:hypothetical protein
MDVSNSRRRSISQGGSQQGFVRVLDIRRSLMSTSLRGRRMFFNKRITGWANVVLQRGRVHRREDLMAVL